MPKSALARCGDWHEGDFGCVRENRPILGLAQNLRRNFCEKSVTLRAEATFVTMTDFFSLVCSEENLWKAWTHTVKRRSPGGLDRVSVEAFGRDAEANLRGLRRQMLSGAYRPVPLRGVFVPKADGTFRPCGAPSMRDRIAQRAFLNVVVPVVDARFWEGSHAYRPARSIHTALTQVEHARDRGYRHVFESDIEKCFESINREMALGFLGESLPDERVLGLVRRWLENPTDWGHGPVLGERGISQGDLISPFLCNVVLDRFDASLVKSGFRIVRYADDFLIPLRRPKNHESAREATFEFLSPLQLQVAPRKTRLTSFEAGFDFLGAVFVGQMMMPRQRRETPSGKVRWGVGYEDRGKQRRSGKKPTRREKMPKKLVVGAFLA